MQLKIAINFISYKDNDEEHVMHSKSYNMEIMINDESHRVIKIIFEITQKQISKNFRIDLDCL